MTIDGIVTQVVRLPIAFHQRGNVSMHALLKESGYFDAHELVTVERIRESLSRSAGCVDAWLAYSEDKRSSGWFVREEKGGEYIIGSVDREGLRVLGTYCDKIEACAAYVKLEIEQIMGTLARRDRQ